MPWIVRHFSPANLARVRLGLAAVALLLGPAEEVLGAPFRISTFVPNTLVGWTNAFPAGVCCLEGADSAAGPWIPERNLFTTNSKGQVSLTGLAARPFCRLAATDIGANNPGGFANLTRMYGVLTTIAGNGAGGTDGVSYWQAGFEGAFATNVALSRPHFAVGDTNGNVFILDKNSHSLLKVTADGRLHTVAGTHAQGNGPDTATPATSVRLNYPNGLWMGGDGTLYILDTGNNKVRWMDTNGIMTTLLTYSGTISGGRGVWVRDDRLMAYFVDGGKVRKWTPGSSMKGINNVDFVDPGNIWVDTNGLVLVTDRGAGMVYSLNPSTGVSTPVFGNGGTGEITEGVTATASSIYGVRAVWPLPTGGWFLGMQEGSQVAYVDPANLIHVWVNGYQNYHTGDGLWFYSPGFKISEVRSVTMDPAGNLLIVENDYGYVRRVQFLPMTP